MITLKHHHATGMKEASSMDEPNETGMSGETRHEPFNTLTQSIGRESSLVSRQLHHECNGPLRFNSNECIGIVNPASIAVDGILLHSRGHAQHWLCKQLALQPPSIAVDGVLLLLGTDARHWFCKRCCQWCRDRQQRLRQH